jgi:hypothetical protein
MTAGALDAVVVTIIPSPGPSDAIAFGGVAPVRRTPSNPTMSAVAPASGVVDNQVHRHRLEAEPRCGSAAAGVRHQSAVHWHRAR